MPAAPRYALGVLAAAAVVLLVVSRMHRDEPAPIAVTSPPPPPVEHKAPVTPSNDDVTAELANEPVQLANEYRQAVDELLGQAPEIEKTWTEDQRKTFHARVATLSTAIEAAADGKPRRRAYEAMVQYLEGALARDEVALAGGAR
jgi:hypothetical protein